MKWYTYYIKNNVSKELLWNKLCKSAKNFEFIQGVKIANIIDSSFAVVKYLEIDKFVKQKSYARVTYFVLLQSFTKQNPKDVKNKYYL